MSKRKKPRPVLSDDEIAHIKALIESKKTVHIDITASVYRASREVLLRYDQLSLQAVFEEVCVRIARSDNDMLDFLADVLLKRCDKSTVQIDKKDSFDMYNILEQGSPFTKIEICEEDSE